MRTPAAWSTVLRVRRPFCRQASLLAAFAAIILVGGCATRSERADRSAFAHGYERVLLSGTGFQHVAYFKPGGGETTLHVYIEHDGIPWATPTQPAADPTPRRLVMLELMALDPAPALYLGRPCYFGMSQRPPCEAIWWTHRRFSEEVIRSMETALSEFLRSHERFGSVELFGYSGGGVIATLMAREFPGARRLVTVAAPLDLEGWTQLHHYAPLAGSIDPLRQPALPSSVTQLHIFGRNDDVVPGDLIRPFVSRQPNARYIEVPGLDHYCCWEAVWAATGLGQ